MTVVGSGAACPFRDEGLFFTPMMKSPFLGKLPGSLTRAAEGDIPLHHLAGSPVRAVDADGVPSAATTIAVKTTSAPLALARVQGLYDVTLVTESSFGYSTFPDRQNSAWRFVPVCEAGACDVDWRDLYAPDVVTRLDRAAGTYSGSAEGRYTSECRGHQIVSALTFRLRVTRAKVVGDTWRATALEGHVTQREAEQLGCRGGGVDSTVRLVLYA